MLETPKNYVTSSWQVLRWLMPYLWPQELIMRVRVIISFLITFTSIVFTISTPYVFKYILALFTQSDISYNLLSISLISYGLCWLLSQLCTHIRYFFVAHLLNQNMRLLTLRIFNHLLSLSMRFHIERRTGALTKYVDQAQQGFNHIFSGLLLFLIPTTLEMVGAIILIGYLYGIFYGSLVSSIMLLYLIVSIIMINWSTQAQNNHLAQQVAASSRMVDSLLNYETIKLFNNEDYEDQQADILLQKQEDAGYRNYYNHALVQIAQSIIIGSGLICLTWYTGNAVYDGMIYVGDFVLINGCLLQFIIPLNHFGYIMQQTMQSIQDTQSLIKIMQMQSEVKNTVQAINLSSNYQTDIVFNNVYFSYDMQRPILKGVSFNVPAGTTVALVGPTGAGKSTIARLLFRFYDVHKGNITINNHDIRRITQDSLRKKIAIVPQDTVLFNDTLFYNIAYGNPQASLDEIHQAAKSAHLDEFINSLPNGYNTLVGERGLKLSGGEKQRVAIARVLLKKPEIYIFDEATSALDIHTEREIQKNLKEISTGITTIIIAHRLSTIIHADNIIVLDQGTIIEQGLHHELLSQYSFYSTLWHQQYKQQSLKR